MLKNIKDCDNGEAPKGSNSTIYVGSERYPRCYFGVAHVGTSSLSYPLFQPHSSGQLPDWIESPSVADAWDEPRQKACEYDEVYCKTKPPSGVPWS